MNSINLGVRFKCLLRPWGKHSFLTKLKFDSAILDVGCGNNSPYVVKSILPMCNYTGIDIGEYNQTKPNLADNYIITDPENFANEISKFKECFDAVISSHNIEHCNDREKTLDAMLKSVKHNGQIYLAFPCENSVNFPNRISTLNYFDDSSHKNPPPNFEKLIQTLIQNQFEVEFSSKQYRPILLQPVGFILEPVSKAKKKVLPGTVAYYGFESIIWAKKSLK
jgi:SAM-dependent methyltransferase